MSTELDLAPLQRQALSGPTMGTRYSAIFFAPAGVEVAAIGAALHAAVDRVDAQMSTWKPNSDLSRFNAAPVGSWVAIPPQLAAVIAVALEIGAESGGVFDIGVGDLVEAFGFGPSGPVPDLAGIAALAGAPRPTATGSLEFEPEAGRLRKRAPLRLDLCGIAKGFGVDELAAVLEARGIADYLVSIDGELRAGGCKPGGIAWAVAVERPLHGSRDAGGVIELTDRAVATSGDYRHVVEIDGRTVSHTMDPRTGRPLANGLASVTVLGESCMRADAWATVLMVLGEVEGPRFAARRQMDALFVARRAGGVEEIPVGRFALA